MSRVKNNLCRISIVIFLICLCLVNVYIPLFIVCSAIIMYFIYNPNKWIKLYLIFLIFENILMAFLSEEIINKLLYGLEIISYFIFIILLIKNIFTKGIKINKIDYSIIIFIIISIISSIINQVDIKIFILGLRWFIRYCPIYWIIRLSNWSKKDINNYINLLIKIGIIEIALGFLQILSNRSIDLYLVSSNTVIEDNKFAIFGTMGRYNEYAYIIVILIAILFSQYQLKFINRKKFTIIAFLALIFSYSRQSLVAIIFAIILIGLLSENEKVNKKKIFIALAFIAIIIIIIIPFISIDVGLGTIYEGMGSRFLSMFTKEYIMFDYENKGRLYFLLNVSSIFLKNKPLFGYGMGMYGTEIAISYNNYVYNLLNIPVQFSMDVFWQSVIGQVGVLGLIALINIYINIYKEAYRRYKSKDIFSRYIGAITLITIVSGIIMSFFSSAMNDRYFSFILWSFCGFIAKNNKNRTSNTV